MPSSLCNTVSDRCSIYLFFIINVHRYKYIILINSHYKLYPITTMKSVESIVFEYKMVDRRTDKGECGGGAKI